MTRLDQNRCRAPIADVDSVLLSGLNAVIATAAEHGHAQGIPRQPWFLRILVEQLMAALPICSRDGHAIATLRDPQRGVTNRSVRAATDRLMIAGLLAPGVIEREPVWIIPATQSQALSQAWRKAAGPERTAIVRAAQRTLAASDAWLKTRATTEDARLGTSTSS